jgi:short-subunit dehydrogenase
MTHGLLNPNSLLVASPEKVARDIEKAIQRENDVIYTPWFWRGIMSVIRSIPESVFKRLKL